MADQAQIARFSSPAKRSLIVRSLEGRRLGPSADGLTGDRRQAAVRGLLTRLLRPTPPEQGATR